MKSIITKAMRGLLLVPAIVLGIGFVTPVAVGAQASNGTCGSVSQGATGGVGCSKGANTPNQLFGNGGIFTTIVNVLLFIIGAIAVIMLIIGGIRYVVSAGNAASVTAAKNTILYAIVGLIIALLAYVIVNFVLGAVTTGTTSS